MSRLPNPPLQDGNVGSFAWLNWYKSVTTTVNGITTGGSIQLTGDVTGNGNPGSPITTTLANSGVAAGTYNNVTVDAKGRVINGSNTSYITGNQTISLTGDATGSGTTSISVTLATSGVAAGTYSSVTVNTKGIVTGGSNPTPSELSTSQTPTASTKTVTHTVPILLNGVTYYMLLSSTGP